ncbi:MAG TPA: 50S ribosomal protein L25/general stress protein Ctc [Spirochaetota bacterium]|nr:50S ribosomal protein L25/general stress protein Ctc [Spirochaetota bacterium]
MQSHVLNADLRTEKGKNACNKIRSGGFIPAVMYSHGESEALQVSAKDFSTMFKGHISESVLIDLNIKGKSGSDGDKVFIKDYQVDPVTDKVIHLDFYKITAGEKITTKVPVELVGTPTGARKGGILEHMERDLEIECLPRNLREKIEIDVTNLEIGESIHIKDLKEYEGVEFLGDGDRIIVAVLAPTKATEKEEGEAVEGVEAAEAAETSEGEE